MAEDPQANRGQRLPRSERRIQLLEAALGVFVEKGYHLAAMDDIAASAGVSKPVLYQHFPGKLELYLALIDQQTASLEGLVRNALTLDGNKARIATMVDTYFDFVSQEGAAFRLIFESDLANEPQVRSRLDRIEHTSAKAMADIITSESSMEMAEAMLVGVQIVGIAQTSARYWLGHQSDLSKEAAARVTSAFVRRGISAFPAYPKTVAGTAATASAPSGRS